MYVADFSEINERVGLNKGMYAFIGCLLIWGFRKRAKPDFCFLEFSYYYEHPRIQKTKYGSDL